MHCRAFWPVGKFVATEALDQVVNVTDAPSRSAWTELNTWRVFTSPHTFPPAGAANRDQCKNLREPDKARLRKCCDVHVVLVLVQLTKIKYR